MTAEPISAPAPTANLLRLRIRQHLVWSAFMLALAWYSGVLHDYGAYVRQWQLVIVGDPPWSTDNAYGPLQLLMAPLFNVWVLAPKLLMGVAFAAATGLLLARLTGVRAGDSGAVIPFLFAITYSPLIWGIGYHYGLNDTLAAALVLFAALFRLDGRHLAAGVFLALAALLKFYPLALVPFFMLDGRTLKLRGGLLALGLFAGGMAIAYAAYGVDVFRPLSFGAERGPKLLSILSALKSSELSGGAQGAIGSLIKWNGISVVATLGALFVLLWWRGTSWLEASALGMLAMLVVYKTGHQQFYMSWFVLVAALPLLDSPQADRLARLCIPMLVFVSLFHFGYAVTGRWFAVPGVREFVGYAAFPFGVATIWLGLMATSTRMTEPLRLRF